MMLESTPMLPQVAAALPPDVHWFSPGGCVVEREDAVEVAVGGILVGSYRKDDVGARNAILVGLAADPKMHLGHLAQAFGLSEEMVRVVRRRHEREGLAAIVVRRPGRGGGVSKITPALRRRLEALFVQGKSVTEAHDLVAGKYAISRATVGLARKEWGAKKASAAMRPAQDEATAQPTLPRVIDEAPQKMTAKGESVAELSSPGQAPGGTIADDGEVRGCALMQHAGSWLLLGLMDRYGMHRLADKVCDARNLPQEPVRVALDAFATALAIGQGCVEGVRRLATPTASLLLRSASCPSADWVRRTLHEFSDVGAERFHLGMAGRYLEAARADNGPAVFYVDNHLRPYTGQAVIRRGWRMQDKRVLPGSSDYYVHDEDGRPTLRTMSPSHASLTEVLLEIADLLRAGLGEEERILLAFDRGGAFPQSLAALRDNNYEFVTYERRPYRLLLPSEFTREMELPVGDDEVERLAFAEYRVPLGRGRGDVRRIAIRTPEERQVNLLAISQEPAERLIAIQRGRWRQENGLKHGVERWSINQLDGRRTEAYAPETIVPNPARRRLNRALRLACVDKGLARRLLARLDAGNPKREAAEVALAEALGTQRELIERRAVTPTHAPLSETELAGKLVYHPGGYKTVLDTVRIAAANAEADLAEWLAPHLPRATEAKKTVANLFAAPGRVRVGSRTVRVDLAPAGTGPEHRAFAELFRTVNAADLRLPGDPRRRVLRFRSQIG
jgi:transposase-like protein